MRKQFFTLWVFLGIFLASTGASVALPPCPPGQGSISPTYHNCFGTYTFIDGSKYVGEWRDDRQHGTGTYIHADGRVDTGIWEDDKFQGPSPPEVIIGSQIPEPKKVTNAVKITEDRSKTFSKDYSTLALRHWLPLAKQGNANAQLKLGMMYAKGTEVIQNYNAALKWYRLAAEQGNAQAQFNLAWIYAYTNGVTQDDEMAYMWSSIAIENGLSFGVQVRDDVEQRMTAAKIVQAKQLLNDCMVKMPVYDRCGKREVTPLLVVSQDSIQRPRRLAGPYKITSGCEFALEHQYFRKTEYELILEILCEFVTIMSVQRGGLALLDSASQLVLQIQE